MQQKTDSVHLLLFPVVAAIIAVALFANKTELLAATLALKASHHASRQAGCIESMATILNL